MTGARSDPDRQLFADELRAMRKQRSWSQEDLGKLINYSPSTIANIETMLRAPTHAQAELLDGAFGTPGTFARLEARLRRVAFSAGFRPFHVYEEQARTLKTFEHTMVPGLFQTEDYARAMLETHPDASEQDVQERVEARMSRQAILSRKLPPPPRVWAVLDEQVFNRDIGGSAVMLAQMQHLAELATRPRTNIQVIPAARPHQGLLGAFMIAETDQMPAIVYLDTALDGLTVEDTNTAEALAFLFDTLRMEALTGGASLALIEEAVQRWTERSET